MATNLKNWISFGDFTLCAMINFRGRGVIDAFRPRKEGIFHKRSFVAKPCCPLLGRKTLEVDALISVSFAAKR